MVRRLVDLSLQVICTDPDLTETGAFQLVQNARDRVVELFPGKESTFDLIYLPRFHRAISERFPAGKKN